MELRGHTMGHLLSALTQAYANTGDSIYKTLAPWNGGNNQWTVTSA